MCITVQYLQCTMLVSFISKTSGSLCSQGLESTPLCFSVLFILCYITKLQFKTHRPMSNLEKKAIVGTLEAFFNLNIFSRIHICKRPWTQWFQWRDSGSQWWWLISLAFSVKNLFLSNLWTTWGMTWQSLRITWWRIMRHFMTPSCCSGLAFLGRRRGDKYL